MKELRYLKKTRWYDYGKLQQSALAEAREKFKSPDKLKGIFGDGERGVTTGTGWVMQAFVEDAEGELRPQSFEETTACIGCHGGVGAGTDSTFSFERKLGTGSFRDGWFHPSQRDLTGVPEPKRADGSGEYAHYLAEVGGGDDFRSNRELYEKFFTRDGRLDAAKARAFAKDIALLVVPSAERALELDRAYLALVKSQRLAAGRDVFLSPPQIQERVEPDADTGIETAVFPAWKRPLRTALR
jgi:hypothetical protein